MLTYLSHCRRHHHHTKLSRALPHLRGTKNYTEYAISQGRPISHFKSFDSLHLSSIGMGTYLGQPSEEDDQAVENAVFESVKSGAVNVIDTAINYRAMRSEKSIGRALLASRKRQDNFTR